MANISGGTTPVEGGASCRKMRESVSKREREREREQERKRESMLTPALTRSK